MDLTNPQVDSSQDTLPPRRSNRRLRFCVAAIVGLICCGIGAEMWRRQSVERLYKAGLAAIPQGDLVVIYRAMKRLSADSARAKLLQGALDLRSQRPESALRNLQIAVKDPETALWAQFLAGEALCQLQDYEAAMTTLRGALEQDPDNIDGHRWMAVAAFDIGATAEAIEHLRHVIRLDSKDPRAYRTLGLIYTEAEEFPQAIDAYQASLKLSREQPDIEQILAELGNAQVKVHLYQDVLATLEEAPASPELDSLRAEALYALGRTSEAKAIVQRVLRVGKTSRALILQGLILLDEGRASEAVVPLQQAVVMQPEDFETRAKLTQAYSQSGNAESARHELAEFERIKAIRQEIHELTLAAANQPDAADLRYELGVRYRKLGLLPTARKWIRAALALDPSHQKARKVLAELSDVSEQK